MTPTIARPFASTPHWTSARARLGINAGLVLLSLALLTAVAQVTGRIDVRGGHGWDGGEYAGMLEDGWRAGSANTALRPLIVLLNRPAFLMLGDAIASFRLMNHAYVALLALAMCLLFDRYSRDTAAKVLVVVNVLLSIATLKYISFYPVQIDAGAYAVLTVAMVSIVAGWRPLTAVLCLAAVASREFSVAVLAFGAVRDLRLRVPLWKIVLTYAPAAAFFLGWRFVVTSRWAGAGRGGDMVSLNRLLVNLQEWLDPMFAALFMYFLATVFGGASLFLMAKAGIALRHLRREPEWAVFIAAILAAAATGRADMWRYLAYLVPAVVVLLAVAANEIRMPRRRVIVAAIVCAATVLTQRPLQAMNVEAYFRDWFPAYVHVANVPEEAGMPELWPLWAWRFMMAVALLWILTSFPVHQEVTPDADRA